MSDDKISSVSLERVDDHDVSTQTKELGDEEKVSNFERTEYLISNYAHDVGIKVLSTQDDPTQSAFTFRFLFLGFGLSAFGSVLAQIYYFKPQPVLVAELFLLLVSYFLGNFMAMAIPSRGFFRYLNPGPFNIKEHAAIVIMASTASVSATASEIIAVEDLYYNKTLNAGLAIFMLFSTQLMGYGFACILRESLVYPTATWWPTVVTSANVLQVLHSERRLTNKRVKFFWIVFCSIAVWEIVPQYLFPFLSGFSIVCVIANGRGDAIRNIFGGASNNEGAGLLAWSFDWNNVGLGSLYTPWETHRNVIAGYVFVLGLYYGNVWKAKNFPFMSQTLFYENGTVYDQSLILTNNVFDPQKYAAVGAAYFSASNVWGLIVSNLVFSTCLVHVSLFHWKEISGAFKFVHRYGDVEIDDPHYNEMKKYKNVPRWQFILLFAISFTIAQVTNYKSNSGLPWWALIVLLIVSFMFTALYGYLVSVTGFLLPMFGQGFFQTSIAFIVPGKPIANMFGTVYGQHTIEQGVQLLSNLKFGQYVKVPPRINFFAQIAGSIVGSILNYVMILQIVDNNRSDLLSVSGTRLWSGQNPQLYNSNAISWGALAPQMFGRGGPYFMVPISLAIGLVLPIPFWLLHKKWPTAGFNQVFTPIIAQSSAVLNTGINSATFFYVLVGIISQYYVRRKMPRWFTKYNYILSGALDGGTQVMIFILSFAVFGAAGKAITFPTWWGNPVLTDGLSVDRCKAPPQ